MFFYFPEEFHIHSPKPANFGSRAYMVAQMVKNLPTMQETGVWSLGWEDPLEEGTAPTPVFLPGESHGQRSLVGYSPWGHERVKHDWNDLATGSPTSRIFNVLKLLNSPQQSTLSHNQSWVAQLR